MATFNFRLPHINAPDTEGRIAQIESYLNQLVRELEWTFNSLDTSGGEANQKNKGEENNK